MASACTTTFQCISWGWKFQLKAAYEQFIAMGVLAFWRSGYWLLAKVDWAWEEYFPCFAPT